MRRMKISAAVGSFLARPLHAVLATHGPDGEISQSVVWYRAEEDSVWISCRPGSVKARHVANDPRVSLLVLAPHGGSYVRLEGKAMLDGTVSDEQRLALISPYQGADAEVWLIEHPLPSPNALLRIRPERVITSNVR